MQNNNGLYYHKLYIYQIERPVQIKTDVRDNYGLVPCREEPAGAPWVQLTSDGIINIRKDYSWDGATGPVFNTPDILLGSLVHDGLYQLMRERKIPLSCRAGADSTLRRICRENGMGWFRAWYVWAAVRMFGWMFV
jgi:hypothetical protein